MKNKRKVLAFLMIMIVGANTFVYASDVKMQSVQNEKQKESLAELYHKAGLDKPEIIIQTLADLGISDQDLEEAVEQGKKVFEILEERKITLGEFKEALSQQYASTIKQAKKDKIITWKEARCLTKLLKQRMDAWKI